MDVSQFEESSVVVENANCCRKRWVILRMVSLMMSVRPDLKNTVVVGRQVGILQAKVDKLKKAGSSSDQQEFSASDKQEFGNEFAQIEFAMNHECAFLLISRLLNKNVRLVL